MKDNTKPSKNARKLPDYLSGEIARALISHKKTLGFNDLFAVVFAKLKENDLVRGGEEMLRLRAYEKLQNMVVRGLVEKKGKEYQTTKRLENEDFDGKNTPPAEPAQKSKKPIAKSFINEAGKETQIAYIDGYWVGDRMLEGTVFTCNLDSEGYLSVTIHADSKPYFESLNTQKWLESALSFAEKNDTFYEKASLSGDELQFHEEKRSPAQQPAPKPGKGCSLEEVTQKVMGKLPPKPATQALPKKKLAANLSDLAFEAARAKGAVYPVEADSSDGKPVIVDTDSGDCYEVIVTVRKIK